MFPPSKKKVQVEKKSGHSIVRCRPPSSLNLSGSHRPQAERERERKRETERAEQMELSDSISTGCFPPHCCCCCCCFRPLFPPAGKQKESIARRNYRSTHAVMSSNRDKCVFWQTGEKKRKEGNNEAGGEAVIDGPQRCSALVCGSR